MMRFVTAMSLATTVLCAASAAAQTLSPECQAMMDAVKQSTSSAQGGGGAVPAAAAGAASAATKFCSECGKPIPRTSKFCPECGKPQT